ncbi:MAG: hypothetical protein PHY90_02335 [Desulfitobacteriaceae bacterium]|nr:hypothetical protein [Desulfitobacteriaceae bacterium]
MRLVEQVGHIDAMPYDLMLKTLDHIEINVDGMLEIIFLVGTRIEYTIDAYGLYSLKRPELKENAKILQDSGRF